MNNKFIIFASTPRQNHGKLLAVWLISIYSEIKNNKWGSVCHQKVHGWNNQMRSHKWTYLLFCASGISQTSWLGSVEPVFWKLARECLVARLHFVCHYFSLEALNLKEQIIGKIKDLYFCTWVSASFGSCSSSATLISESTCKCVRNKERRRDENPPGWNECSCVAPPPPPPCVWSVPREENPWMGLSQNCVVNSHLLSVWSGSSTNIPGLAVLHLLKLKPGLSKW